MGVARTLFHRAQRASQAWAPRELINATPSAAIIDSQSVKCADTVATGGSSGYDAVKKIKGRIRHILTNTQGLLPDCPFLIIQRSDAAKGFVLLPRRWVVERTFGWLVKARRLVRDHERNPRYHEVLVYTAMIGHSAGTALNKIIEKTADEWSVFGEEVGDKIPLMGFTRL